MPALTDNPMTLILSADGLRRARQRYETQALHLGTYEAAIESMLRRMRNQADGGSQFYLYRVQLRDALTVEEGWRDEDQAEAARACDVRCRPGRYAAVPSALLHPLLY
jgi:hypothetical protein